MLFQFMHTPYYWQDLTQFHLLVKEGQWGQFACSGLYERRNLLNQKPAVIDRRYKKAKVTHYPKRVVGTFGLK